MSVSVSDSECQILVVQGGGTLSGPIEFLSLVASKLGVPYHVCTELLIDSACLTLINSKLLLASNEQHRNRLLVAGTYLEEQVTVCAMNALAQGYEVFLLKDCVAPRTNDHVHAFDMRLFQAGAVLTTLSQLLYEWLSQEEVRERQLAKRNLLEQYGSYFARPAQSRGRARVNRASHSF